jgi:hypothetical protein
VSAEVTSARRLTFGRWWWPKHPRAFRGWWTSALSPIAAAAVPEVTTAITHLRDVLGDPVYESVARKGETMTTATMATHAYDQIDEARTELNAVSK